MHGPGESAKKDDAQQEHESAEERLCAVVILRVVGLAYVIANQRCAFTEV